MNEGYQCQCCGNFVNEDEGITCVDGSWVCDNDSCRTLDEENEAHIKQSFSHHEDALEDLIECENLYNEGLWC